MSGDGMEAVLAAHRSLMVYSRLAEVVCSCSPGSRSERYTEGQHRAHVADALRAAGYGLVAEARAAALREAADEAFGIVPASAGVPIFRSQVAAWLRDRAESEARP